MFLTFPILNNVNKIYQSILKKILFLFNSFCHVSAVILQTNTESEIRKGKKKITNREASWIAKWGIKMLKPKLPHIQVHPNLKQTLLLFIRVSSGSCLDSRKHCDIAVWLITSIRTLGVADYNEIIFKVTPVLDDKWIDFSKWAWWIDSAGHREISCLLFCYY